MENGLLYSILSMEEEELIKLCIKGDSKAMNALYEFYVPKMRGLCFRYVRTVFEVDDVLQDAFVKVFMKLDKYNFKGSFEGWVRKIVINTAINYYHSNQNFFDQVQVDEIYEKDSGVVEVLEKLSVEDLYTLINKLPSGYRFIFNMFAIDGYSHKEIAETLGITESTSRSQYTRARKHLINLLEKNNYVDSGA